MCMSHRNKRASLIKWRRRDKPETRIIDQFSQGSHDGTKSASYGPAFTPLVPKHAGVKLSDKFARATDIFMWTEARAGSEVYDVASHRTTRTSHEPHTHLGALLAHDAMWTTSRSAIDTGLPN